MTPRTLPAAPRSRHRLSSRQAGLDSLSLDAAARRLPHVVRGLKAMANPARLRLLALLTTGELCVCQLTAVLSLAASTTSGHLADLRAAGLVTERKEGKWVHYRLTDNPESVALIRDVLALLSTDAQTDADADLVRQVRRIPVETLSRGGCDLAAAGRSGRTRCSSRMRSRRPPAARMPDA